MTDSAGTHAGFTYTLPRTDLRVVVVREQRTHTYGRYACLAPHLGLRNETTTPPDAAGSRCTADPLVAPAPVSEPDFETTVEITPVAVPDPEARFYVHLGTVADDTAQRNLRFTLTDDNFLTDAQSEGTEQGLAIAGTILRSVTTVFGGVMGIFTGAQPQSSGANATAAPSAGGAEPRDPGLEACVARAVGALPQPAATPNAVAGRGGGPPRGRQPSGLHATTDALAQAPVAIVDACRALARLERLTQARDNVLAGASGIVDAEAIRAAVDALTRETAQLRALFGRTVTTNRQATMLVMRPASARSVQCIEMAGMSARLVPAERQPTSTSCQQGQLRIRVTRAGTAQPSVADASVETSGGLVFRVPAWCDVDARIAGVDDTATNSVDPLFCERMQIAQFGGFGRLPNSVRGSGAVDATLSPATGAVRSVALRRSALDTAAAERIDTAAASAMTAVRQYVERRREAQEANRAREETSRDPVRNRERALRILELERSIQCLRDTGEPCPE